MNHFAALGEKWGAFRAKAAPVLRKTNFVINEIFTWIFRLRKVFMACPVVYYAVKLARENMARLPEAVGMNMQSSGEYAMMVSRDYAVYGPLGVTAFCLLLMFCSRKAVFPWIVSIFSLALPILIYLTNVYPS